MHTTDAAILAFCKAHPDLVMPGVREFFMSRDASAARAEGPRTPKTAPPGPPPPARSADRGV